MSFSGAHAIAHGDVLAVLKELPDNEFDALLCDPPYGFSFMGKAWDYDVPSVDVWRECLRVLKPGAPLIAFGGTRTFHRIAVGIEDAGFELRDVLSWMYGSGFPKSLDVSKAIDKGAGADRRILRENPHARPNIDGKMQAGYNGVQGHATHITAPATDLARQWDGYGTALKPAWEPAILARKPLEGTVANNVAKWGCGALAIDACRIEATDKTPAPVGQYGGTSVAHGVYNGRRDGSSDHLGRWPANVCMDEDAAAALDAQAGNRPSSPYPEHSAEGAVLPLTKRSAGGYSDDGGPSRFYYVPKVSTKERGRGCEAIDRIEMQFTTRENEVLEVALLVDTASSVPRVICVSGMSSSSAPEWNTFLFGSQSTDPYPLACRFTIGMKTGSITESRTWRLSPRLRTSASTPDASSETETGGSPAPSAESSSQSIESTGTSAKSARPTRGASPVTLRELFERSVSAVVSLGVTSNHPTLKPIALAKWLASLIKPPTETATLLVPYSGAGSEMIGALTAGWPMVFGIEGEAEYIDIAHARIAAWAKGNP